MTFKFKHLATLAAFIAVGAVHAETITSTLTAGASEQGPFTELSGSMNWSLSTPALAALNAVNVQVESSTPGWVNPQLVPGRKTYASLSVNTPLVALTGNYDGMTLSMSSQMFLGANNNIKFSASADNMTTTGGSLLIDNLVIDLKQKTIYGDVIGGNGIGEQAAVALWGFGGLTGSTDIPLQLGLMQASNVMSGVHLLPAAAGMFATSLGLLPTGQVAFGAVTDYGTITTNVSIRAVPEASPAVLMGLGLMGVAMIGRRRRTA